MIEDQERCMKLAKPMLGDFYEIWHHAFDNYQEYPVEFTADITIERRRTISARMRGPSSSDDLMAKTSTSCIVSEDCGFFYTEITWSGA